MARDVLAAGPWGLPATSRLSLDAPKRHEILAAHGAGVERREAGYVDPVSGLSAWFLADRGYCCERGCRHGPYAEDPSQ